MMEDHDQSNLGVKGFICLIHQYHYEDSQDKNSDRTGKNLVAGAEAEVMEGCRFLIAPRTTIPGKGHPQWVDQPSAMHH